MKRIFILSAMLATFSMSMAQEVKTYSVYDNNQSNDLDIADITGAVEQVKKNVAASSTQQYVTAEDLNTLFSTILSKLNSLESDIAVIKEKLGIETSSFCINGHEFVDLGISDASGNPIYWAKTNVGAENAWDYGDYFAWGETIPYYVDGHSLDNPCSNWRIIDNRTITGYCWDTYKYCKDSYETMTKYCNNIDYGNFGFVDNKITLDSEDDAAVVNWGGEWRMPNGDEFELILSQCYWQWVERYNDKEVNGYVVYKVKADADKGKFSHKNPTLSASYSLSDVHIFLPAGGSRDGSALWGISTKGTYWSSTIVESKPCNSRAFYFSMDATAMSEGYYRYTGRLVRPVYQMKE